MYHIFLVMSNYMVEKKKKRQVDLRKIFRLLCTYLSICNQRQYWMETLLQVFTVAPSAGVEWYCIVACDTVQSGMHSNTLKSSSPCLGVHTRWLNVRVTIQETRKHSCMWLERGLSPRCVICDAATVGTFVHVLPLEVVRTLTVKHSSIRWMFCVLFISKSDCILIHCGINKVLKEK